MHEADERPGRTGRSFQLVIHRTQRHQEQPTLANSTLYQERFVILQLE